MPIYPTKYSVEIYIGPVRRSIALFASNADLEAMKAFCSAQMRATKDCRQIAICDLDTGEFIWFQII